MTLTKIAMEERRKRLIAKKNREELMLKMYLLDGMDFTEIGMLSGVSTKTVHNLVNKYKREHQLSNRTDRGYKQK